MTKGDSAAGEALPIGLAPRLQVLAAAALFSTGGVAIKGLALSSWQVAGLRSAIAAAALALMLPAGRRTLARHVFRPGLIGVGMAYGATLVLFVVGNKLTTAANTIFLQSTAPLYVLLLAPWLLAEPVRRRDVVYMATLAVGLGLFFVGRRAPDLLAPDPFTGNLVAVASGVTWALTLLGLRRLGRGTGVGGGAAATSPGVVAGRPAATGRQLVPEDDLGAAAVLLGNLFACAFALPLALGDAALLRQADLGDWVVLAYLGVVQIGFAYVLLTRAFRRIGALEAALLLLVEPVLNPIWTWMAHGEEPGGWALAGGAVILGATGGKAVFDARRARAARRRRR